MGKVISGWIDLYGNLFNKVKVDFQELTKEEELTEVEKLTDLEKLTDEEQWEEITKSWKF
jgi:hypothetical protein